MKRPPLCVTTGTPPGHVRENRWNHSTTAHESHWALILCFAPSVNAKCPAACETPLANIPLRSQMSTATTSPDISLSHHPRSPLAQHPSATVNLYNTKAAPLRTLTPPTNPTWPISPLHPHSHQQKRPATNRAPRPTITQRPLLPCTKNPTCTKTPHTPPPLKTNIPLICTES
jgi:hypothetical protein